MIQWLRRRFLAGFFVTVPLAISVFALYWIFGIIDGFAAPLVTWVLPREAGPLQRYSARFAGLLLTLGFVLLVGAVATNVIGRRVLARTESWLLMIPGFRAIYAPVKQLVVAFSPDNEYGFKRVVLVEDAKRGLVMGFLTKEFTIDRGQGLEPLIAVYVPTNHLYIGDIGVYQRERAFFPDLTVEEGVRIFLTGGMSLPGELHRRQETHEGRLLNEER
ncbi:MAG TPA: DUF502 domain-containing protein [Vicinamibacterales bacterium]|nr:DUF502 domain-containing protein [Vicinamibacterales bacterium]